MRTFALSVLVFILVFLTGSGIVLWLRTPPKVRPVPPAPVKTEAVNRKLPPLELPGEKSRMTGSDSWEFTGETNTNFVTAKARFTSQLMHDGWRLEKQIALDESISPRVLLTLRKQDLELVLMLWKQDGNTTGFAYKREKIIKPGVSTQ